jgi:hypothetical protein
VTADDELEYRIPDRPRLAGVVRDALVDFYFNSWRLVPANVIWGVGLLGLLFFLTIIPLAALIVLVLLALPVAGIFRIAALIVRSQPVAFSDALAAWRAFLRPALVAGVTLSAITIVLVTNVVIGFSSGEPIGWAFATAAGWGLLATWSVALPLWPLLVDPLRDGMPQLERVRLAVTVVFVRPGSFALLMLLVAVLVATSIVLFAALLTVSVAFVALLAARYTLPTADRIEGRETQLVVS